MINFANRPIIFGQDCSHHLSHDRAGKGQGSIPYMTSQTALYAFSQRLNTMQI